MFLLKTSAGTVTQEGGGIKMSFLKQGEKNEGAAGEQK